jgi:hypothetical protein
MHHADWSDPGTSVMPGAPAWSSAGALAAVIVAMRGLELLTLNQGLD